MDMIVNSQYIIELRKSKAWSQQHLADVSGLSLRTVQRIENSNSGAPDSIKAIAMAFSLVPADLMKTPEATEQESSEKLQNGGQLRKIMPVAATIAIAAILGTSIWIGSSSFTVVANGYEDGSASRTEIIQSNTDPKQQKVIMDAALSWLAHVDSQDYNMSWQASDPVVHSQVNAEQWQKAVQPVRASLGNIIDRKLHSLQVSTSMPGLPDGEYALLVISSVFENKAESFETVPMSKSTGQWKPMGYFIR